jgi:hypothetical protein
MESRFTFDDIQSSGPQPTDVSSAIAKLTQSLASLKAKREIFAHTRRSAVSGLNHQIEKIERSLLRLNNGAGRRKQPARR